MIEKFLRTGSETRRTKVIEGLPEDAELMQVRYGPGPHVVLIFRSQSEQTAFSAAPRDVEIRVEQFYEGGE